LLLSRGIQPDRVQVIYNGINPSRLQIDPAHAAAIRDRLKVTADDHVVTILASLTPPKGHDILLRALRQLRSDRVRLAIVGDGPRRAELESLAASIGVADRVVFFGLQRQVADFLAASDVLVCASRDNEGCSNSIVEAMALGVPVVATRIGGNPELIEDGLTGWLVPTEDPASLARVLDAMLADAANRQRVGHQARRAAQERFSLTRMVSDYERIYGALLEKRRTASEPRKTPTVGDFRISV
jgi:glycosyltransferase involved in cell wall biosynthesis